MTFKKPIKNKDIIVSIDIALNLTGVAIMDFDKQVYSTFTVESTRSWNYYKKLDFLFKKYKTLFSNILNKKPKSVTLILEDRLKAGWSGSTLASIEGARVTCYHAFMQEFESSQIKTDVVLYNPGLIKKHFTNKQAAKKEEVYKSATKTNTFIKKYRQEDILDAIYLGVYHIDNKI